MAGPEELAEWWIDQARAELEATLPKVKEYSAVDLEIMGAAMDPEDRKRGIEMAIAFYVLGTVSYTHLTLPTTERV